MNTAIAHIRPDRKYSGFHKSLLCDNSQQNYALKYLYSVSNTKEVLTQLGWTKQDISSGIHYITIDVWAYVVRVHVPKSIPGLYSPTKSISRFISKKDFVNILFERIIRKADSHKISFTQEWDVFSCEGTEENYRLSLELDNVSCTCHAYRGVREAFQQDEFALKHLINHPVLEGQIPDKHVFSLWKYFKCYSTDSYRCAWTERISRQHEIHFSTTDWEQANDDELFLAEEQAKDDLFGGYYDSVFSSDSKTRPKVNSFAGGKDSVVLPESKSKSKSKSKPKSDPFGGYSSSSPSFFEDRNEPDVDPFGGFS